MLYLTQVNFVLNYGLPPRHFYTSKRHHQEYIFSFFLRIFPFLHNLSIVSGVHLNLFSELSLKSQF
jgi:hypothetical protein